MSLLDKFSDAIGNDPANCVVVVGAGLSKKGVRAGNKGLPDWDELTRLMVDYLEETKRCSAAAITQFRAWLAEDPPRYLEIAEAFRNEHTHDLDGYERFLRRHLRPDDLVESELHQLILGIGFKGIVCYNFDLVFEKQSDKLDKIVYPDLLEQVAHFRRKGYFAKIHGCIDRPATQLVLTASSFQQLSSNPNYSRLFEAIFLANWVLCIGFSLRDPDFQSILANLKQCWDTQFPPVMALMQEPGEQVRADWLRRGVDILPYADHGEVKELFQQLAGRYGAVRARPRRTGDGRSRGRRMPVPASATLSAPDAQATELQEFISTWQAERKIAGMDALMSQYLTRLRDAARQEAWLFRVAAMCPLRDRTHLCHHLIATGTPACLELTRQILTAAAEDDELRSLSPDLIHLPVFQFAMADLEWKYERGAFEHLLKWIFDADWTKHGVDLTIAFRQLLSRILAGPRERRLSSLYVATEHIPGAAEEIERLVLAPGFIRGQDRMETSWDKRVVEEIRQEKLKRLFFPLPRRLSPAAMLDEAAALENPEDEFCPCIKVAAQFLLSDFVHASHLGLHFSSSLYDPAKAKEIVDALASLQSPRQQIVVLWAINHWAEDHRGMGSLLVDTELLRAGMLVPLWWRYSSETRMRYLAESNRHRDMVPFPRWTGQEFLLSDMMGLRYDVDEDFRKEFNKSLGYYDRPKGEDRYIPWQLQGLWSERELTYELVETAPPELARRVVTRRANPEGSQHADKQWEEAEQEVQSMLEDGGALQRIVSAERRDYVIDNLLGAYDPSNRRVILFHRMLSLAADDLGIDRDALSTIVYIHETVHAFAHLGRDLNDRIWNGSLVPEAHCPEYRVTRAMEGIAQFYTYKLLERLDDRRLLDAFLKLEDHSEPLYREWRKAEQYSLEAMRAMLMRLRDVETDWPPIG